MLHELLATEREGQHHGLCRQTSWLRPPSPPLSLLPCPARHIQVTASAPQAGAPFSKSAAHTPNSSPKCQEEGPHRVVLQCQFPVGPLYYRVRSALGHLQDVIVIPPAGCALLGLLCKVPAQAAAQERLQNRLQVPKRTVE